MTLMISNQTWTMSSIYCEMLYVYQWIIQLWGIEPKLKTKMKREHQTLLTLFSIRKDLIGKKDYSSLIRCSMLMQRVQSTWQDSCILLPPLINFVIRILTCKRNTCNGNQRTLARWRHRFTDTPSMCKLKSTMRQLLRMLTACMMPDLVCHGELP